MSHVVRIPEGSSHELGEPLLFQLATRVLWGTIPDGFSLNLHPMAFAAWFGMLATALNLFPIGQLDGGHISYAALGPRSSYVTMLTFVVVAVLAYFHSSWTIWTFVLRRCSSCSTALRGVRRAHSSTAPSRPLAGSSRHVRPVLHALAPRTHRAAEMMM